MKTLSKESANCECLLLNIHSRLIYILYTLFTEYQDFMYISNYIEVFPKAWGLPKTALQLEHWYFSFPAMVVLTLISEKDKH